MNVSYYPGMLNMVAKNHSERHLTDPDIAKIINDFDCEDTNDHFARQTGREFVMLNCVLYHCNDQAETERAQLFVPEQTRKKIVEYHHDSSMTGHNGAGRTYRRISRSCFWPDIN